MTPSPAVAIELAVELLAAGRTVRVVNLSDSLWPLVRRGDALELDPGARLDVGALAAVLRSGRLVVHRVVALDGDVVRLKGDANGHEDPPVRRGEVVAVATAIVRPGGRVVRLSGWAAGRVAAGLAAVSVRTERPWSVLRRVAGWRRRLAGG
jgi:hypothetical protein